MKYINAIEWFVSLSAHQSLMKFYTYYLKFIILICVVIITGCSVLPEQDVAKSDSSIELDEDINTTASVNPYLANPRPVSTRISKRYLQAVEHMQQENWSEARDLLLTITTDAPNLSGPWLNLGIIYRRTDANEEAMKAFERAIEINGNNLEAYNQLALMKRDAGEFEQAKELYSEALSRWPEHVRSHRNLAILYDLYMGRLEYALAHYEKVQSLQPEADRMLTGWIVDLKRRMQDVAQVGGQ